MTSVFADIQSQFNKHMDKLTYGAIALQGGMVGALTLPHQNPLVNALVGATAAGVSWALATELEASTPSHTSQSSSSAMQRSQMFTDNLHDMTVKMVSPTSLKAIRASLGNNR